MDIMAPRQRPQTYLRPSPYDKNSRGGPGPRPPPNMARYPPRPPRYFDRKGTYLKLNIYEVSGFLISFALEY